MSYVRTAVPSDAIAHIVFGALGHVWRMPSDHLLFRAVFTRGGPEYRERRWGQVDLARMYKVTLNFRPHWCFPLSVGPRRLPLVGGDERHG